MASPPDRRTWKALLDFARDFKGDRVHLRELDQVLTDRAFGFLLLVFALPNVPPLAIPGLSTLTGIPLAVVAWQLMCGIPAPRLPRWLAQWSVPHERFLVLVVRFAPRLGRIEQLTRPRWPWLHTVAAERMAGMFCLLLAVVLILPIPFGNSPPALAVALIGLGIIGRDGIFVIAGVAVGLTALALAGGVAWAIARAGMLFLGELAGA
jgi:hypothetical protein